MSYYKRVYIVTIIKALDDAKITKPVIMMHLTSIAEQFSKIKDQELLKKFDDEDINRIHY